MSFIRQTFEQSQAILADERGSQLVEWVGIWVFVCLFVGGVWLALYANPEPLKAAVGALVDVASAGFEGGWMTEGPR